MGDDHRPARSSTDRRYLRPRYARPGSSPHLPRCLSVRHARCCLDAVGQDAGRDQRRSATSRATPRAAPLRSAHPRHVANPRGPRSGGRSRTPPRCAHGRGTHRSEQHGAAGRRTPSRRTRRADGDAGHPHARPAHPTGPAAAGVHRQFGGDADAARVGQGRRGDLRRATGEQEPGPHGALRGAASSSSVPPSGPRTCLRGCRRSGWPRFWPTCRSSPLARTCR